MGRESDQVIFCQWDVSGSEPQNIGIFPIPLCPLPYHVILQSCLSLQQKEKDVRRRWHKITLLELQMIINLILIGNSWKCLNSTCFVLCKSYSITEGVHVNKAASDLYETTTCRFSFQIVLYPLVKEIEKETEMWHPNSPRAWLCMTEQNLGTSLPATAKVYPWQFP